MNKNSNTHPHRLSPTHPSPNTTYIQLTVLSCCFCFATLAYDPLATSSLAVPTFFQHTAPHEQVHHTPTRPHATDRVHTQARTRRRTHNKKYIQTRPFVFCPCGMEAWTKQASNIATEAIFFSNNTNSSGFLQLFSSSLQATFALHFGTFVYNCTIVPVDTKSLASVKVDQWSSK